jgi:hypothetical protein
MGDGEVEVKVRDLVKMKVRGRMGHKMVGWIGLVGIDILWLKNKTERPVGIFIIKVFWGSEGGRTYKQAVRIG